MRFLTGAPALLLRNSRKTECGAKQFLACLGGRAAPFALLIALWLVPERLAPGQSGPGPSMKAPAQAAVPAHQPSAASLPTGQGKEKLTYAVEWRLIRAGIVTVEKDAHQATMHLESAGIVSTLFRIQDVYTVNYEDATCATSSVMDSMERERHHETRVTYDRSRNHATFIERDLIANTVLKETGTDIPNCVADTLGAFTKLRSMNLGVGQSTQIAVSDGRKSALVKVTGQEHEGIKTPSGMYQTIRYSADLMNNVVYSRKGEVFLWLSDDARRLPVQIRIKTSWPISTVTLDLEKEEYP